MDPRIIKTREEHKKALKEVESLLSLDPDPALLRPNVWIFFLAYRNLYVGEISHRAPDPIYAIVFRMDEQGLKQRDLVPFIGSKSKVSEVLP